jgi:hypothetical protein
MHDLGQNSRSKHPYYTGLPSHARMISVFAFALPLLCLCLLDKICLLTNLIICLLLSRGRVAFSTLRVLKVLSCLLFSLSLSLSLSFVALFCVVLSGLACFVFSCLVSSRLILRL